MRFWRETLHIKLRPSLLKALTKESVMSQTLPGSYQRFWGGAPRNLLRSYQAERRPNVREVIALTKMLGREICERDPAAADARSRRLRAEFDSGKASRYGRTCYHQLKPPGGGGQPPRTSPGRRPAVSSTAGHHDHGSTSFG